VKRGEDEPWGKITRKEHHRGNSEEKEFAEKLTRPGKYRQEGGKRFDGTIVTCAASCLKKTTGGCVVSKGRGSEEEAVQVAVLGVTQEN